MLIPRRMIVGLFVVQALTGLLLITVYSPSTTTAWGSVWYIQTQVPCGWIIRGLHHFTSDAMILLLALYVAQLLVPKLYRSPHRFIWWTALVSLVLALALSLRGHLLPWDQEGYWGTKVRTNILARTPLLGEVMAKLLIGGANFGNLTLTRFYTLHVAILPLALGWLIFRYPNPKRQRGVNPSPPRQADEEAVQRRPTHDPVLVVDRDKDRIIILHMIIKPRRAMLQRPRFVIIRRRGVENGLVIDLQDAGKICAGGGSYEHRE